ncbi:ribosomal protein [Musa troglodytarum]|uniref:Ribosomal protein n=1 Tax=Musa troglodytarum TaxID=320322 RepID=A0A9E7KYB6_9LILI|nr:ribosomal protein [Musa troglodytarum]
MISPITRQRTRRHFRTDHRALDRTVNGAASKPLMVRYILIPRLPSRSFAPIGCGGRSRSLCPFKRYVEIGRVALVNYGKEYGRLVVIVDVIDQNRALVDAPDMVRGQMNFKRLSLTDIKIDIPRVPKKKTLIGAMEAADVKNKWEKSSWGRKLIVQKRRASLNDFDRFKVMLAKIKRGGGIRQELAKLRKENAA